MKRLLIVCTLLLFAFTAQAKTVYDVELPDHLTIAGETLQLNGYGLRKFLFFKIYLGSLYTPSRASSTAEVLTQPGAKLIRMNFIYHKVKRDQITDAFDSGFRNNFPQLTGDPARQQFLQLFKADFLAGDQVDLEMTADGTVRVTQNGSVLGSVKSTRLQTGLLLVYLGEHPADEDMKEGMLGKTS